MKGRKLNILWTNADPLTSENMVMLYAYNSITHGWWDDVNVIIWGATAQYVAEDERIQQKIQEAKGICVTFEACITCAEELGVKDKLEDLGIATIKMGPPLTEIIQNGEYLITV